MLKKRSLIGIFKHRDEAKQSLQQLESSGLSLDDEVLLMPPGDLSIEQDVVEDSPTVRRSLIRWHLICGAGGLAGGLAIGSFLVQNGPKFMTDAPGYGVFVTSFVGLMVGLLLGGFFGLRADQGGKAMQVKDKHYSEYWRLIVTTENRGRFLAAEKVIGQHAAQPGSAT